MTDEHYIFSLQDVLHDWRLMVLFVLLLVMMSLMIGSFLYWNIVASRMRKMILCGKLDAGLAIFENQKFSSVFSDKCIRRPLIKAVVYLLMAMVVGIITTSYCVIYLTR